MEDENSNNPDQNLPTQTETRLTLEELETIRQEYVIQGKSMRQVAATLNRSYTFVQTNIKKAGLDEERAKLDKLRVPVADALEKLKDMSVEGIVKRNLREQAELMHLATVKAKVLLSDPNNPLPLANELQKLVA